MSDSTSIHELPVDPAAGSNTNNNIQFSANEKIGVGLGGGGLGGGSGNEVSLDQTTINQIVSGLQQASSTGATQLKSRDIPMSTQGIAQDPQVQPNYIPPTPNQDYIEEMESNEEIIESYNKKSNYNDNLDQLYDEIQIPLLLSVLFFLFQLPVFKKALFTYFPVLFFKDGNINIYGYLFKSALFGLLYYLLVKIMSTI